MNLGYVVFLIGALAVAAMILMSYIRVQSDIIISVRNIASLERELNNLKLSICKQKTLRIFGEFFDIIAIET